MRVRVSELTGAALDWAVGKLEGELITGFQLHPDGTATTKVRGSGYRPSSNWRYGGPIIEENDISIECFTYPYDATRGPDRYMAWRCGERHCLGPSPLVAAMRCYCQSKLGYEVEVPEELTEKERG